MISIWQWAPADPAGGRLSGPARPRAIRRRDERLKLELYDRFGVLEYWMFDPDRKGTRIYRRDGGRLRLAAELSITDVLSSPLLPGLKIPLAAIFK